MSEPTPPVPKPSATPGKKPVVVVSGISKKEFLIGILFAIGVLGLIVFGVMRLGDGSPNRLQGTVVSRYQTGEKETLLGVSRKGVTGKTADTGFYLKVKVEKKDAPPKEYEVMVSELDWNKHKVGSTIYFVRPENEQ